MVLSDDADKYRYCFTGHRPEKLTASAEKKSGTKNTLDYARKMAARVCMTQDRKYNI